MPLLLNGAVLAPACPIVYNGTRVRTVRCNGVTVWRANVTLTNLVTDADEAVFPWSDIGHTGNNKDIQHFTARAGRLYYIGTKLSYFAYGPVNPSDTWWAFARISLDGVEKLARSEHVWPDEPPVHWHGTLAGDGGSHLLRLDMERYNSPQGFVRTLETMVVDVTELGAVAPDTILAQIGFFRGSKTITL